MGELAGVFFQMDVIEFGSAKFGQAFFNDIAGVAPGIERDAASDAKGKVQLGGLVVLRHVRVEVTFAIPLGNFRRMAAEHQAGQYRAFDGVFIEDGQGSRESHADGADVGVGFVARSCLAGTEHLALCFDLAMDFKTYGNNVIGEWHGENGLLEDT